MKKLYPFVLMLVAAVTGQSAATNNLKPASPLFKFASTTLRATNSPAADTNATEIISKSAYLSLIHI